MQFERLELKNFEGYKNAEIDFTKGLNIITGRNSTGKTTILEALLFALYGAAPGAEKKLLVSKLQGTAGNMAVKLSAKIAGKSVEILREGRLIGREDEAKRFRTERLSLKIDGKEVPIHNEEELNRKIIELVGMGVKMFTTLVYTRQGELTDILEPKKEDMDLILGITLMKELVEQLDSVKKTLEKYEGKDAATMLTTLQEQLPKLTREIDQLTRQVNTLSRDVKVLEEIVEKAKSKEVERLLQQINRRDSLSKDINDKRAVISNSLKERGATSVEELEKRLRELADREGNLRTKLQGLQEERSKIEDVCQQLDSRVTKIKTNFENAGVATVEELEEKIASAKAKYDQLIKEREVAEAEFNEVEQLRSELHGKVSALKGEIKSHEELLAKGLANCPTCGQEVDPEVVKQIIEGKRHTVEQLTVKLESVNARYYNSKERVDRLRKSASQLEAELKMLQETHDRIITLLEGATIEQLEQKLKEMRRCLNEVSQTVENLRTKLGELESDKKSLQDAIANIKRLEEEKKKLEEDLQKCLEEIKSSLQALAFPFKPDDVDLKAKIAEKLPLSPEELANKEAELRGKREQLKNSEEDLKRLKEEEEGVKGKIGELQKRLERAKLCEDLLEKIKDGIERQRELRLRRIADEALRVYESLTDQRVYKAFRINKDDYTVEVFPSRLEGYIPAKRTGGGHQTLIALAVRVALLNVLGQRSLMIIDEPTYGVDSENLPQLMSYFSEAAKKIGQTILVTHYGLGEEEAANIIRVSIAEDGSSVASRT
jgi:exonuclease SbcC